MHTHTKLRAGNGNKKCSILRGYGFKIVLHRQDAESQINRIQVEKHFLMRYLNTFTILPSCLEFLFHLHISSKMYLLQYVENIFYVISFPPS